MRLLAFDMEERCDWGYHCEVSVVRVFETGSGAN
jgi:hypothetical protein